MTEKRFVFNDPHELAITEAKHETIDITPESCRTVEGAKRVNDAMAAFTEARENVARVATSFVKHYGDDVCRQLLWLKMTDESEEFRALVETVDARITAEDAFVRAVAGR